MFQTFRAAMLSGSGDSAGHRPPTASTYSFPAEFADAATVTISNHGCSLSNRTNRWPTIPVAPKTATFNLPPLSLAPLSSALTISSTCVMYVPSTLPQRLFDQLQTLHLHSLASRLCGVALRTYYP